MAQTGTVLWQDNSTYNMFSANTTQAASGEGVVADPYFATNTVTLLNFDNLANGTTTLPTKDLTNMVWPVSKGTAQISTSIKKYGTGSIYLPSAGGNSSITLSGSATENTASSAFNMGTGNFTAELWAYPITTSADRCMLAFHSGGGNQFLGIRLNNSNVPGFTFGNSSPFNASADAIASNTWHHFAVVRNGATATLYVNGTAKATQGTANTINIPTILGMVGRSYGDNLSLDQFKGYVDDVRITKGIARYTANFTPPAGPFATS